MEAYGRSLAERDEDLFHRLPRGWYFVALSGDIAAGTLNSYPFMGREIVVFRPERGEAAALDAHCPHLGAHFGHGGKVVGETLKCPLHGRQFGVDGALAQEQASPSWEIPEQPSQDWFPYLRPEEILNCSHRRGLDPSWLVTYSRTSCSISEADGFTW
jgi:phenylpropionate dioxygenase-like ring-hydroxylating dioxygenase large terminal subunit